MASYTIHSRAPLPGAAPAPRRGRASGAGRGGLDPVGGLIALREGFSWGAFLLGPVWLLAQGALAAALADLGVLALLVVSADTWAWSDAGLGAMVLTWRVLIGFEGRDAVRAALGARGFALDGIIEAVDEPSAVARHLASLAQATPATSAEPAAAPPGAAGRLFPKIALPDLGGLVRGGLVRGGRRGPSETRGR